MYDPSYSFVRYKHGQRLQLSATRSTRYGPLTIAPEAMTSSYAPRQCTPISSFHATPSLHLPYGEFDTVGVVVYHVTSSVPTNESSTRQLVTVYVSDAHGSMLAVKLWGGLKVSLQLQPVKMELEPQLKELRTCLIERTIPTNTGPLVSIPEIRTIPKCWVPLLSMEEGFHHRYSRLGLLGICCYGNPL